MKDELLQPVAATSEVIVTAQKSRRYSDPKERVLLIRIQNVSDDAENH